MPPSVWVRTAYLIRLFFTKSELLLLPSTAAEQISKLFISDEETLVVAVFVTGSGELHDAAAA